MTSGIYALKDPDTNEIRYIGRAADVSKRFRGHLTSKPTTPVSRWIARLAKQGKRPEMTVLAHHDNPIDIEEHWITWGRENGYSLLNVKCGGHRERKEYDNHTVSILFSKNYRSPMKIYRDAYFGFTSHYQAARDALQKIKLEYKKANTVQDKIRFEIWVGNHICQGDWPNKLKREVWNWAHEVQPKVQKEFPNEMVIAYE